MERSRVGSTGFNDLSVQDIDQRFNDIIFGDMVATTLSDVPVVALDLIQATDATHLSFEKEVAERTEKLLGQVALLGHVDLEKSAANTETTQPMSLAEALKQAKAGSQEATNLVRQNVGSDYMERAYKSGHVVRVDLEVDSANKIIQFGQTLDDVHVNSLVHMHDPTLQERAKIEARNSQRRQILHEQGVLKDYVEVTYSLVPDTIPVEDASKIGYFTETMSCAIQCFTEEDGKLVIDSAFVAGADSEESARFDKAAVVHTGKAFGFDYGHSSVDQILARPLLIHKSLLPGGLLDIVAKYDEPTGRFFGRRHQGNKDYHGHLLECRRREEESANQIEGVTQQLISEANSFTQQAMANKRLDQLNDQLIKQMILCDESIDSNVLGKAAQPHVEDARAYYHQGNIQRMEQSLRLAQKLGVSSSCPDGPKLKDDPDVVDRAQESRLQEDCTFISKQCPKCKAKNVLTTCKNGRYIGACGCKS